MENRKAVIGMAGLPIASRDMRWDAVRAEKRVRNWAGGEENMDWGKYKKAFFYVDEETDDENFTSYKLQFADIVEGKLQAVPRALIAVKAALLGARGGVEIPMPEKKRIARKLNAYLEKLEIDVLPVESIKSYIQKLENRIEKIFEKTDFNQMKETKSINIVSTLEENDRVLNFVATDETLDRDDDILSMDGWDVSNYMKNPVVFHEHTPPVVAKVIRIETDEKNRSVNIAMKFPSITEMSTDPEKPGELALFVDTLYNMYKNGYMKGVSVRFRNLDSEVKMLNGIPIRFVKKMELLEISLTGVPANPNALRV